MEGTVIRLRANVFPRRSFCRKAFAVKKLRRCEPVGCEFQGAVIVIFALASV
jgi:hypothetical protein